MSTQARNWIQGFAAPKGAAEAAEYWTPERQAEAKPVPAPRLGLSEDSTPAAPPDFEGPEALPPQLPQSERGEAQSATLAGATRVGNPKAFPYTACGKLFFTQGDIDYFGSAAVVSKNVLLTAGHCVHRGRGLAYSTNVAFYPAYPIPGKSYSYGYLAAWTAWSKQANRAFDYGMIWIDDNIGDDLGHLGLLVNASTSGRSWKAIGYPAEPSSKFDGKTMWETTGSFASSLTFGAIGMNNNDMKKGSNGGNWITDYNGAPNYANGLQSFYTSTENVEYGPYFTSETKDLLDWITDPENRN